MTALLAEFYFLKLYDIHLRPTKANSPKTASSRPRGWKIESANKFSRVPAPPILWWMDCFHEYLLRETSEYETCRCGWKLGDKFTIRCTWRILVWVRDTEAQGYNRFLCYHSWDLLASLGTYCIRSNTESQGGFPLLPMLVLPNSEAPLGGLQKCTRAVLRTCSTLIPHHSWVPVCREMRWPSWEFTLNCHEGDRQNHAYSHSREELSNEKE